MNKKESKKPDQQQKFASMDDGKVHLVFRNGLSYKIGDLQNVAKFIDLASFIKSNYRHDIHPRDDEKRISIYDKVFSIEVGGKLVQHNADEIIEIANLGKRYLNYGSSAPESEGRNASAY